MCKSKLVKFISFILARMLVEKECSSFVGHLWDYNMEFTSIESVHVVLEFQEVFSMDFFCMPTDRGIDFCIDLELSMHPISIPSYLMALKELGELKTLLYKFLIRDFFILILYLRVL